MTFRTTDRTSDTTSVIYAGEEGDSSKRAIIVGAGPAGLTAALELLERTDCVPIVLEQSEYMGGISRTVNYKGNRIDIGGHRFFSKSDRVVEWWKRILPVEAGAGGPEEITYHQQHRTIERNANAPDARTEDRVMLVRERRSRIFYLRKFFDYPIRLSVDTVQKLGIPKMIRIGLSYFWSMLHPIRPEKTLEQFFINRFGRELYNTFFRSYTEKVWGVACHEIGAEWGAQRIKGLSILKTLQHALKKAMQGQSKDVSQKGVETSLIERFLYPKFGPGQMWEEVARRVQEKGGIILTGWKVEGMERDGSRIVAVHARHKGTGERRTYTGEYYFSTMPVQELIGNMEPQAPADVREIAAGLQYRDFLTVGLLCDKLKLQDATANGKTAIKDNWIYIQEPDVLVGRLQIFNNWSPYMVADPNKTWIGLEYFCNEGDALWGRTDDELRALAKDEMDRLGIVDPSAVLDSTVIRMPKTYPAYFGTYERFPRVIEWINGFSNLVLVGRNGMHKYNNQDHSMLTAMVAVDGIAAGAIDRGALWALNTEQEYHEEKAEAEKAGDKQPSTVAR
ncbi:MAG: NAD(P)/FAD-dependent oxidoreductase [Bryobacteraceae bacterium]